jgi:hypothetical protein
VVLAQRSKGWIYPLVKDDLLEGAEAIAKYLGKRWNERKVRHAREIGSLPIRKKEGMGLYAFKSELSATLWAPNSLPAGRGVSKAVSTGGEIEGVQRSASDAPKVAKQVSDTERRVYPRNDTPDTSFCGEDSGKVAMAKVIQRAKKRVPKASPKAKK